MTSIITPSPIALFTAATTLTTIAPLVSAYKPFGYQSDSTDSVEYRNPSPVNNPNPTDPSSYTGSIHYDPLHHALYLTGSTYASSVFDGVDVFELTTAEKDELEDDVDNNDGYWWEDMATGLKPHLLDLGVPEFEAAKGDCFYAVMGLPVEDDADGSGEDASNEVKLVHSRRFGSEQALEACSAVDIIFPSPKDLGYTHDFKHTLTPSVAPLEGTTKPPYEEFIYMDMGESPTYTPMNDPDGGSGPTAAIPAAAPSFANTGPQSKFRAYQEEQREKKPPTRLRALKERSWPARKNSVIQKQTRPKLQRQQGQRTMQTIPMVPSIQTRSVRLLMAGHIESPTKQNGYIIENLSRGHYDQAKVYGFAQQVDIRLPIGEMEAERPTTATSTNMITQGAHNGQLDYHLHKETLEEEELAQELGMDWQSAPHNYAFDRVVTSGVESRAILNDNFDGRMQSMYPVSMVADPTSKKHYYVVLLASADDQFNPAGYNDYMTNNMYLHRDPTIGEGASQRSWTDYDSTGINVDLDQDNFGKKGRPNFGGDYRIIVKKMTIESIADDTELSDSEKELAAKSHEGELIAMRHSWMQEFIPDSEEDVRPSGMLFAPSGDAHGKGDVLIMVGTTGGRGSAFGTATETTTGTKQREDLDGFVTKIRTDTGAHAGMETFDIVTNMFGNDFTKRIKSNPGQDDIVSGLCAKPLRASGPQEEMDHVYVVGSTSAILPAMPSSVRSRTFVRDYPEKEGVEDDTMEAYLMKIDLSTMNTVWTVQVAAIVDNGEKRKGNAFGYGCAVTRDGKDVYLTGLVKENGVVTDFSDADYQKFQGGDQDNAAKGGTDIFVSSYKTSNGSLNFIKQVGSTKDDFPSRGNGGITTDKLGNAIVTGNTRGSLMRERSEGEYRYGETGKNAASDVFIMSFDRDSMDHLPMMSDAAEVESPEVPIPVSSPTPVIPRPSPPNPPSPTAPKQITVDSTESQEEVLKENGALVGTVVGIVGSILAFVLMAVALVVYRINNARAKENNALMDTNNLHGQGQARNIQRRRTSTWGMNRRKSNTMQDFEDLNIMVEVRNSASGGWHGVYDDEQLMAIDFGAPSGSGDGDGDVVEQSLFMEEDGLKEIEDNLDHYEIGDMDEVSDEDLIKAYNDAMALDAELENPDVEFAMQGIGSEPALPDEQKAFS